MEYQKLGHSELVVSRLGLGCVTFGREIDAAQAMLIMDHAIENGITLFDTAEAYGGGASETVVGDWLTSRGTRDNVVLATKVNGRLTREHVRSSVDKSLNRLQAERIDLLQLHVWDEETPLEETLEALTSVVDEGKVRYVGCSNYSATRLTAALAMSDQKHFSRMTSVQPPYNLVQRDIETDLLPLCEAKNVGVISYSPLAAGFLTGKYRPNQPVPPGTRFDVIPGHQNIYFTDHGYQVLEQLDELAERTGQTHIQLALSWVLHQPNIASVLVGARTKAHIDQALEASAIHHQHFIREPSEFPRH